MGDSVIFLDAGSSLLFCLMGDFTEDAFIFTFLVFTLNLPLLPLILLLSFAIKASSSGGKPDLAPLP